MSQLYTIKATTEFSDYVLESTALRTLPFDKHFVEPVNEFPYSYMVISLGNCCRTASAIRELHLNSFAYPFDWALSTPKGVRKAMKRDFKDFIAFKNLQDLNFYDRIPQLDYKALGYASSFKFRFIVDSKYNIGGK